MTEITLDKLLEVGAYFGHPTKRQHPKIAPYLYGEKDGVSVFDLEKTKRKLEEAIDFLCQEVKKGKVILFVATKKQAREKVKEVATALGFPYVVERWLGGTLTNFEQMKKTIKNHQELRSKKEAGLFKSLTKKERVVIERKLSKFDRFFSGLLSLEKLPDIIFIIDIRKERIALNEARAKNLRTVAVVDSNCDPTLVDYPIPMNDDSIKAISYLMDLLKDALMKVKTKAKSKKK